MSAYLTLAEKLSKKKNLRGEAFNFSNETQKNVLELTNLLITIMGSSLKPIIQGNNNGEIKAQFLDSTKSKELLDWRPTFGIEEGLKKTVLWYKGFLSV